MKTHLALFLCLSVLLSGCITAATDLIKPEPDSGADVFWRFIGGWWDVEIAAGPFLFAAIIIGARLSDEARGALLIAALLAPIGLILGDTAMRNALPYRKAYYEAKESEEKAMDYPEEEPSESLEVVE